MRKCFKCQRTLSAQEFWPKCAYCIDCDKAYRRIWRKENKERYAKIRKQKWLQTFGRKCKKCGAFFVGKGLVREYCSTKCKLLGNVTKKRNGCWTWKGPLHPAGYAYTTIYETNKKMHAHRASFLIFKGEIPNGLYVCHKCDNPSCINPDHLWAGTAKENMQDAKSKGRLRGMNGRL